MHSIRAYFTACTVATAEHQLPPAKDDDDIAFGGILIPLHPNSIYRFKFGFLDHQQATLNFFASSPITPATGIQPEEVAKKYPRLIAMAEVGSTTPPFVGGCDTRLPFSNCSCVKRSVLDLLLTALMVLFILTAANPDRSASFPKACAVAHPLHLSTVVSSSSLR